ncbi:MAG: terminase [Dehalococcoidia bacterium]|jgi:hypothetical protein
MIATSERRELFQIVGDKVRLNLHAGQTRVWDSKRRFVFMIAGTQGGKTSFGPWWLWREIEQCGSGDYIAATATYDLFKLKMLPEVLHVFEDILHIGRYWAGDGVLEIRNPETGEFDARKSTDPMYARVILRSAQTKGGLESATIKGGWLDEVGLYPLLAWEAVRRRLSLSRGRVLGTTTPYNLGWLKQQVYDRWRAGDPDIDVIQFTSVTNPAFPQEEFDDMRQSMPGWKFMMFYGGQFEKPAGLIYSDFIDDYRENGGHKVRPFVVPVEWPRYGGIDPGGVNTAKLWLAHDTIADVYYLYRESLDGNKSTKQHVKDILDRIKLTGERVITWHIGQKSEGQQRMDYRAAGLTGVVDPDVTDVESGIDRVIELLKDFRLFIFDTCIGTLDQMGSYARELDDMGEPTEAIKDKAKYHYLDGLRYLVAGLKRRNQGRVVQARAKGLWDGRR